MQPDIVMEDATRPNAVRSSDESEIELKVAK